MKKQLVFDLYGTLVDIHTEEDDRVWENTAVFFGFYGAAFTGPELKAAFRAAVAGEDGGQAYECWPEARFDDIMDGLFRARGVNVPGLGLQAAQVFRLLSLDYVKLYPGVLETMETLRKRGYGLWLLSNAQRAFTAYELRHLGLEGAFDGVFLSSDYGVRKPDRRFYEAFLRESGCRAAECVMIGNDRETDMAGARRAGMETLFLHTNLTPADQAGADPEKDNEWEGWDRERLLAYFA